MFKASHPARPRTAEEGRSLGSRARGAALALLLLPALGLALACHKSSTNPNDVGQPPVVVTSPASTSTVTGRRVDLTVTTTGASLTYQWHKDGQDIYGGWSATYTLWEPMASDAGVYTVTVKNAFGTATSAPATLTVATAVTFPQAVGIAVDPAGNLYVSDATDHAIWKVDTAIRKTLLAGKPGVAGSADGVGGAAQFDTPGSLALDPSDPAGSLIVADTGNHTIRRVALSGTVTTLAGTAGVPGAVDAVGAAARFKAPFGVTVAADGTIFVSDTLNYTIRRLATDGTVSTWAGQAGVSGYHDDAAGQALFNQPNGLALGANGTLYIADYGNSCIRALSTGGQVTTLAGLGGNRGFVNGVGSTARFTLPVGLALGPDGTLWVADTGNHAIRSISPQGSVATVSGVGTLGNLDGVGSASAFNRPCALIPTASGSFLVADTGNQLLRLVTPAGTTTTVTQP